MVKSIASDVNYGCEWDTDVLLRRRNARDPEICVRQLGVANGV